MDGAAAEQIAVQAFSWLSADDELVLAFLDQAGADMSDLAEMAGDPQFLAAVLDFVLSSDDLVYAFADFASLAPEKVGIARQVLPGAEIINWT